MNQSVDYRLSLTRFEEINVNKAQLVDAVASKADMSKAEAGRVG